MRGRLEPGPTAVGAAAGGRRRVPELAEKEAGAFCCGLTHVVLTIPHDIKTLRGSGCGTPGDF